MKINYQVLTILALVLSAISLLFSMATVGSSSDCNCSLIDLKEFKGIDRHLKKIYRDIISRHSDIGKYKDQINNKYNEAVKKAGGKQEFHDAALKEFKEQKEKGNLQSYFVNIFNSLQLN
jgi:hypothetical protein